MILKDENYCPLVWHPCLIPSTASSVSVSNGISLFWWWRLCDILLLFDSWVLGEWTPCSVTCGDGIQTRDLTCKQEISATLTMRVNEAACLGAAPSVPRMRNCNLGHCAKWHTSDWGKVRNEKFTFSFISFYFSTALSYARLVLFRDWLQTWIECFLPCRHLTSPCFVYFLLSARRVAVKEWGTGASTAKDLTDVMSANPIARRPKDLPAAIFAIWAPARPTPGFSPNGLVKYVVSFFQLYKNLIILTRIFAFVVQFAVFGRMRHWHSNTQSSLF